MRPLQQLLPLLKQVVFHVVWWANFRHILVVKKNELTSRLEAQRLERETLAERIIALCQEEEAEWASLNREEAELQENPLLQSDHLPSYVTAQLCVSSHNREVFRVDTIRRRRMEQQLESDLLDRRIEADNAELSRIEDSLVSCDEQIRVVDTLEASLGTAITDATNSESPGTSLSSTAGMSSSPALSPVDAPDDDLSPSTSASGSSTPMTSAVASAGLNDQPLSEVAGYAVKTPMKRARSEDSDSSSPVHRKALRTQNGLQASLDLSGHDLLKRYCRAAQAERANNQPGDAPQEPDSPGLTAAATSASTSAARARSVSIERLNGDEPERMAVARATAIAGNSSPEPHLAPADGTGAVPDAPPSPHLSEVSDESDDAAGQPTEVDACRFASFRQFLRNHPRNLDGGVYEPTVRNWLTGRDLGVRVDDIQAVRNFLIEAAEHLDMTISVRLWCYRVTLINSGNTCHADPPCS